GGKVHVSAIPVEDRGFVALVHDWAHIEARQDATRRYLFVGFGILAGAAAFITVIAARLSWRSWSEDLRRFLRGGTAREERPEFQPILRDVRELVERLSGEKEAEGGGAWNAQRLKSVLDRHLQGEKVLVTPTREPSGPEKGADGQIRILHPASGLVTALEPVMRACSGTWVAHASGSAHKETPDNQGGHPGP